MLTLPLTIGLIDEGRFLEAVNEELADIQRQLVEFVRLHGKDASTGTRAALAIKVTLQFDGVDQTDYSVKADLKKTVPTRPASVSKAIGGDGVGDGRPCLWVKASGSDALTPRQGKLATDDGRVIDQETGRAKD